MGMNDRLFDSELQHFPQPSRPVHAYDPISRSVVPEDATGPQYLDCLPSTTPEEERFMVDEEDLLRIFREWFEEIDEKSREMLKKLYKEIPLERLVRETVQDFRGRPVSDIFEKISSKLRAHVKSDRVDDLKSKQRGVNIDTMSHEELKQKLERFKVKTTNMGGVKEESSKPA